MVSKPVRADTILPRPAVEERLPARNLLDREDASSPGAESFAAPSCSSHTNHHERLAAGAKLSQDGLSCRVASERGMTVRAWIAAIVVAVMVGTSAAAPAEKKNDKEKKDILNTETFSGLELRSIGPALMSGRIVDFAVDPADPAEYYVAVASGGVWKTDQRRHHLDADLRRARARTRSAA